MKDSIRSVKGTHDFYPGDMAIRNWLYQHVRQVSESYGYQEFEGPFLESIELYAAKSGEELVKEQSFVFPDRSGELITLRPELTPTLARMVAQKQNQLIYPLRWWSWGPFWRYERPQKGRSREFFQWNIDLIGIDSTAADAEMIAIVATFLHNTGLSPSDVKVLINSRELMDAELMALDIPPEMKISVFNLIDRRNKMSQNAWEAYATEIGLSTKQIDGLCSILSNQDLWKKSEHMQKLFQLIESLGVQSYAEYAPHIIRGLDYYTGIVFEVWDVEGDFRSILGGGRYDNLVSDVGGKPLPAVGFAMGDMVIKLVLEKFGCIPDGMDRSPAQVLVTIFDEETINASFEFANSLRKSGIKVSCYPEAVKLGKQFKYADRMSIQIAAIIGPDELSQGLVSIKNLASGEQITLSRDKAANKILQILENNQPS